MTFSPWRMAGAGAMVCAVLVCGCGDETGPGPLTPTATAAGTSSGTPTGAGGGIGGTGMGGGGTGGAIGFSIVDGPSTPCAALGATPTELYAADAIDALYRLVSVSDRLAASSYDSANGFVLFDADGQNPSAALITFGLLDRIAGSDTGLSVATLTNDGVEYGRFPSGYPLGIADR